jgi:hypothetical protein
MLTLGKFLTLMKKSIDSFKTKEEFEDLHICHEIEEETEDIIQLKTNKIPPSAIYV